MIIQFPQQRQQTGWSCLPTAVLCVLEYFGYAEIGMDQVADWCRVQPGGACRWDDSLEGLRHALALELDAEIVDVEGDWESICEAVIDDDEPVIVTIANPSPLAELVGDHAIVVFQLANFGGQNERVVYMDPESGRYEHKALDEFLQWWDTPGQRGFLIRP